MFLYFPNLATSSTIKMKKKRKWHLQKRSDFFKLKFLNLQSVMEFLIKVIKHLMICRELKLL